MTGEFYKIGWLINVVLPVRGMEMNLSYNLFLDLPNIDKNFIRIGQVVSEEFGYKHNILFLIWLFIITV